MPSILRFPIKPLLSQFNKRDQTQNQGGDDSDVKSPVMMVGLVIAALTLLVAMIPLFRCQWFHRWVSSFSIPSFVKNSFGATSLPNPPPTASTVKDELDAIPLTEVPTPGHTLILYNGPNTHFAVAHSNTSPYHDNAITRWDGRVPHVKESLGLRRPPPAATWPFSRR